MPYWLCLENPISAIQIERSAGKDTWGRHVCQLQRNNGRAGFHGRDLRFAHPLDTDGRRTYSTGVEAPEAFPVIVIIAPHLEYPPRNGADIYVERLGCHLSKARGPVSILGESALLRFENGSCVDHKTYTNKWRSKKVAALRTILRRTHYLAEKYLTPQYVSKARELISANPGGLLIFSFICSASILGRRAATNPVAVLTLNDEVAWFQNQRCHSSNLLLKMTALNSERWVVGFLGSHVEDYVYVHITEADLSAYKRSFPEHRAIVVPAGVERQPLPRAGSWDGKIRLLFCGSLSVKMNYDALAFYRTRFWPALKACRGGQVETWVAGSQPTAAVRRLCDGEGWKVYPDLSDEALNNLYQQVTFGILPFPYTTGAKLKLMNFLAAGLPVLATQNMRYLPGQDFFPNLYSDEAQAWIDRICLIQAKGISSEQRAACQEYVAPHTWHAIADNMSAALARLGM